MINNYNALEKLADNMAEQILNAIEKGTAPWIKPWSNNGILPHNPMTGTIYQGVNALKLLLEPYEDNKYLTFNQVKELGGFVKKGEKAKEICFKGYKIITLDDKDTTRQNNSQEDSTLNIKPYYKLYYVFNIEQCSNLDMEKIKEYQRKHNITPLEDLVAKRDKFQENPHIEEILKNSQISIIHTNIGRACYSPIKDEIELPKKETFINQEQYYSTALHELGHATGHQSRLNRNLSGTFGTADYAKEELRAELYSFLQSLELKIDYDLQNHANYVDSWSKKLKDNKQEIKNALKDSVKMVTYVRDNWYSEELKQILNRQYKQDNPQQTLKIQKEQEIQEKPKNIKPQIKKSRGRR